MNLFKGVHINNSQDDPYVKTLELDKGYLSVFREYRFQISKTPEGIYELISSRGNILEEYLQKPWGPPEVWLDLMIKDVLNMYFIRYHSHDDWRSQMTQKDKLVYEEYLNYVLNYYAEYGNKKYTLKLDNISINARVILISLTKKDFNDLSFPENLKQIPANEQSLDNLTTIGAFKKAESISPIEYSKSLDFLKIGDTFTRNYVPSKPMPIKDLKEFAYNTKLGNDDTLLGVYLTENYLVRIEKSSTIVRINLMTGEESIHQI